VNPYGIFSVFQGRSLTVSCAFADLLGGAVKAGAKLGGCPFCLDFFEIPKSEYVDGLDRKGGDYVAAQVGKADVIWM
jgi:hypothetical protein